MPVEDEIKRLCPALSNVVMIGDKRKYNVVVVTLKSRLDLASGSFTDELMNEALAVVDEIGVIMQSANGFPVGAQDFTENVLGAGV